MKLNLRKMFCTLLASTMLLSSPLAVLGNSTITHKTVSPTTGETIELFELTNVLAEKDTTSPRCSTHYQVEEGATLTILSPYIEIYMLMAGDIQENGEFYHHKASDAEVDVSFAVWSIEYNGEEDVFTLLESDLPTHILPEQYHGNSDYYALVTPGSTFTFPNPLAYEIALSSLAPGHYDTFLLEILPSSENATTPVATTNLAQATASEILIIDYPVTLEAYTIDNSNYIKLRDFAMLLEYSSEQFNVEWDGEKNAINLVSSEPYKPVGGELEAGDLTDKPYTATTSSLYKDGELVDLTAYSIENTTYFKLRDLADLFNIPVDYDAATGRIIISPTFAIGQG